MNSWRSVFSTLFSASISLISGRRLESFVVSRLGEDERVNALKPVAATYVFVIGVYFACVAIENLLIKGQPLDGVNGFYVLTVVICFWLRYAGLQNVQTMSSLKLASATANLILFANPLLSQLSHFDSDGLVVFVFLTLIFAVTGVSNWVVIPSIALSLVTLATLDYQNTGHTRGQNGILVLVMVCISAGLAAVMRRNLFHASSLASLAR